MWVQGAAAAPNHPVSFKVIRQGGYVAVLPGVFALHAAFVDGQEGRPRGGRTVVSYKPMQVHDNPFML